MISDINGDTKEIKRDDKRILDLFYEKQAGKKLKNFDSLLSYENIETTKQIICNEELFIQLSNSQKLILCEILLKDKSNNQSYITKIINSADHDLIFSLAKSKGIYSNLNSENRKYLKSKLNNNPWIKNITNSETY